jgi:hypothetical protein
MLKESAKGFGKGFGKGIMWLFRPGFTKENSNPFESCQQGFETVKAAYDSKRNAITKEADGLELVKTSFKQANSTSEERFEAWVKAYGIDVTDLETLKHQQIVMAYLNYIVLMIGFAVLVHMLNPESSSILTRFTDGLVPLFAIADSIICLTSFMKAIKYMHYRHAINSRSLTHIKTTLLNPSRWF